MTFRTDDGGTISGRELIDRFWDGMVRWATIDQPALTAPQVRSDVEAYIATHPDAERVQAEFDAVTS